MRLKIATILFLFPMFLLTSCASPRPVDQRITVIDKFLATNISITKISSAIDSGGLLEIQVAGINKTSFYKKLEYKVEWIDKNGFVISTILSRWTEFPVFGNAEFRFKAVAPKTTAIDFRILIRKGD